MPVLIAGDEGTDDKAVIDRIIEQIDENHWRTNLTPAEDAAAIGRSFDYGLSAGQVQKRLRRTKATVAAAQAVKGSDVARTALAKNTALTLEMAAALAQFEDEPDALAELTEAARYGESTFKHKLQRFRDRRVRRAGIAAKQDELREAGVRLASQRPDWRLGLDRLTDSEGTELTEESHKECQGHTAWVESSWDGSIEVQWYCADPEANGHTMQNPGPVGGSDSGQSDEEKTAERRRVRANNKLWRSAETVRCQFVTELVAGKELPKGALRFILAAVCEGDSDLQQSMQRSHGRARTLLGLPEADVIYGAGRAKAITELLDKANDQRAQVIALGLVLGSHEAATYVDMWKNPKSHDNTARYFKALVGWGYQLSAIEQCIVDGVPAADLADEAAV